MRKLLVCVLALIGMSAFAVDNGKFQEFDNQVSVGVGSMENTTNISSIPTGDKTSLIGTQTLLNFEAERLFDMGMWLDLNANMAFGSGEQSLFNNSNISNYGFNAKVGYAFPILNQHVLLTPYALVGLNNNGTAGYIVNAANTTNGSQFVDNQFFYTGGLGGRLEYRINDVFLVYADQLAAYNWDQTQYVPGSSAQNNAQLTSMLGAKFNVYDELQLGLRGFYSYYMSDSSDTAGFVGNGLAQALSGVGGLATIGLTY